MKKQYAFIFLILIVFAGCKKDSDDNNNLPAGSNFDPGKGWKIVQTITSDVQTDGIGVIGYFGFDFNGSNNNLRCFYWQGWQSQQGFLYLNTRLDEFNPARERVATTELDFENNIQNTYQGLAIETYFMLRNGKTTVLNQTDDMAGRKWVVYENGILAGEEPNGHYTTGIGELFLIDDNSINFMGQFRDEPNNRTEFAYKRFYNNTFEYYHQGFHNSAFARMVGAEVINNLAHVIMATYLSADSTTITVYSFAGETYNWTKVMEQNIAWPNFDFYNEFGTKYLGYGTTPLIVFTGEGRLASYQVDIAAGTISLRSDIASVPNILSMVALDGDIYISHCENNLPGVSKLKLNSLEPVGSPGITKIGPFIDLAVVNNKLYSITYKKYVQHEQIYIATPE